MMKLLGKCWAFLDRLNLFLILRRLVYYFEIWSDLEFNTSATIWCTLLVSIHTVWCKHRETSRDALFEFIVSMENQSVCLRL